MSHTHTQKQIFGIVIACLCAILFGAAVMYFVPAYVAPQGTQAGSVQPGDTVMVTYTGSLDDGTVFDSSASHGNSFQFVVGLGMVRKGFDDGVLGMKAGEDRTINVTPDEGYGITGVPDDKGGYLVPSNAGLVYQVHLVSIRKAGQSV